MHFHINTSSSFVDLRRTVIKNEKNTFLKMFHLMRHYNRYYIEDTFHGDTFFHHNTEEVFSSQDLKGRFHSRRVKGT